MVNSNVFIIFGIPIFKGLHFDMVLWKNIITCGYVSHYDSKLCTKYSQWHQNVFLQTHTNRHTNTNSNIIDSKLIVQIDK